MTHDIDLRIPALGPATFDSPLGLSTVAGDHVADYTPDDASVVLDLGRRGAGPVFERAGARAKLFFEGSRAVAGIVSCGGLCPGMNNVIRGLVNQLRHTYGVRRILGFRYGFLGLTPNGPAPLELGPECVDEIHLQGGTILGSSRGPQPPAVMVDTLERLHVDLLFCIGGDGTLRGAAALAEEIRRRERRIAIVGVPKTIDNDVPFIERTFGFETAVAEATRAITAAHVEACGAPNGVGIVRLMGRHSGFIAASATLASGEVDLCLVPELPFQLDGSRGVLAFLRARLRERGHAVVVAAEGAGQDLVAAGAERDASGNAKLGDIGTFLRDALVRGLGDLEVNVKYIDPSYIVRAAAANPADAIFCGRLAENAVHAAMAGKTALVVGLWGGLFTHVPLVAATSGRATISTDSPFWRSVVESTCQPALLADS
ncbi:MAG: ATP-dependent 6-phosphofructokinase [Deltaproteobacteria bacterium]|nr:ATP-dependent 6-phosphofructokinase [Deltaproteobacteria bacterium]